MTETADEQEAILREGVGLKLELSREELRQKAAGEGKELGPDDDSVSLLAALQQHQEQEAEYLLRDLAVKVRNRVFGESSLYSLLLMQTLVKTAPTIQSVDESKMKAFEKFTWLCFFYCCRGWFYLLTLYTLTSVCTLSILLSITFQGADKENLFNNQELP